MTDTLQPETSPVTRTLPKGFITADVLKDAGITFVIALLLFGSIVGLRTETVNGVLILLPQFGKALALATAVAVGRLLLDVFIWRRMKDGRTFASLVPSALPILKIAGAVGVTFGLALYSIPGFRTSLVAGAGSGHPALGAVTDLITFACESTFLVVGAMAIVRAARLLIGQTPEEAVGQGILKRLTADFGREFPIALLLIALVLPMLTVGPSQRYAIDTATQILIYVMLGWGLNIVVGLAGLLDLGYVAFYAVGAYTYALISTQFGWSFWVCLPLAGFFAALWGITLGFPVLRLRGDYLAIVTMAFGEIIRIVLLNWQSLTGGPNGVNKIPKLTFFGLPFDRTGESTFANVFGLKFDPMHRMVFLYYVILALALLTNFITLRLRRLPIGRAWEALREDEIACRSVGINTVTTKLTAFAIGAMFGGFAGSFFAARQGFISPESFTFMESALVLAIVVLGGLGSQLGVVIAAVILIGSAERFRDLEDYRMLIFGLSMVLVMIWRPRGLMSGRTPSAFLNARKNISGSFVKEGRG
ncbi:high-affinity branched-chain amino acid ABC transporter permease LivM [Rhodomicrobium lacus]|nr:high-affinity branched-chain amino acid ABC transporter permease LivM [Rhodomicrobium lacus]WKW51596.1 high-affinity branched-chain amino acid ABC transporter permease LivM [Rhodomicrobium lacus]